MRGNPLNGLFGNPMMQMMNRLKGMSNPQEMIGMLMQQNPQAGMLMEQIQTASRNGMSPKDLAMDMAKKRGMSEEQVLELFNQLNNR